MNHRLFLSFVALSAFSVLRHSLAVASGPVPPMTAEVESATCHSDKAKMPGMNEGLSESEQQSLSFCCVLPGGGPGCPDAPGSICEIIVCYVDPFCCDVAWDSLCVSAAMAYCTSPEECNLPEVDCPVALSVTCGETLSGSMTSPTGSAMIADCPHPVTSSGDWYLFIGAGEELTISTCGSTNNTRIHVFALSGPCDQPESYVCVGSNDDYCGQQSQLSFTALEGVEYYILISATVFSEVGSYMVSFTCGPGCQSIPENDVCALASGLTSCVVTGGSLQCAQPSVIAPPTGCASWSSTWYDTWFYLSSEGPYGVYQDLSVMIQNVSASQGIGALVWSSPDLGEGNLDCSNLMALACCGNISQGLECGGSFLAMGIPTVPNMLYLIQVFSPEPFGDFNVMICGEYYGCMNPLACNYNTAATSDPYDVCDFSSCICPADLNGDGVVNYADLGLLLNSTDCTGDCPSDLNGDGVVDFNDIILLMSVFGLECSG